MCSECHGQVVTLSLRWRPKPEYVGTVPNIKVDTDKTMKRRSDFILEKLNLNSKNQKNDVSNKNDSLMEAPTNTDEKSAGGHISSLHQRAMAAMRSALAHATGKWLDDHLYTNCSLLKHKLCVIFLRRLETRGGETRIEICMAAPAKRRMHTNFKSRLASSLLASPVENQH
ncbi:hypothetical protein MSG28_009558 [Choristoneura fumiferana]|uniref:Uncharacterized protein n=1 Tax=Choristoneura fumiferana TaxID=7141 RepID=A0ACC0JBX6_CHOFU|nr:hypothetical protein MSG28_009558 [Choristoneura fumiferana]